MLTGPSQQNHEVDGLAASKSEPSTHAGGTHGHRRGSRKGSPGRSDRSPSPVSRTNTPGFPHSSNIAPQSMFDAVTLAEHGFNPAAAGLSSLPLQQPSPGSTSSSNERQAEVPQTYEGLLAANTSLKTRVSELEVINELFRGRVAQLEQAEANARRAEMTARDSESRLKQSLDESKKREGDLSRKISELEQRAVANDCLSATESHMEPSAKRIRLSDVVEHDMDKQEKQSSQS